MEPPLWSLSLAVCLSLLLSEEEATYRYEEEDTYVMESLSRCLSVSITVCVCLSRCLSVSLAVCLYLEQYSRTGGLEGMSHVTSVP